MKFTEHLAFSQPYCRHYHIVDRIASLLQGNQKKHHSWTCPSSLSVLYSELVEEEKRRRSGLYLLQVWHSFSKRPGTKVTNREAGKKDTPIWMYGYPAIPLHFWGTIQIQLLVFFLLLWHNQEHHRQQNAQRHNLQCMPNSRLVWGSD